MLRDTLEEGGGGVGVGGFSPVWKQSFAAVKLRVVSCWYSDMHSYISA